jgi:hypothetical protein
MFPAQIRRDREFLFDESKGRVVGRAQTFYRDLLLREDKDAPVDPARAAEVLADIWRNRAPEIFRADESAATVLTRVALLREKMPEHPWPAWDDLELGDILASSAGNARTLDDLRRLPLA